MDGDFSHQMKYGHERLRPCFTKNLTTNRKCSSMSIEIMA